MSFSTLNIAIKVVLLIIAVEVVAGCQIQSEGARALFRCLLSTRSRSCHLSVLYFVLFKKCFLTTPTHRTNLTCSHKLAVNWRPVGSFLLHFLPPL